VFKAYLKLKSSQNISVLSDDELCRIAQANSRYAWLNTGISSAVVMTS